MNYRSNNKELVVIFIVVELFLLFLVGRAAVNYSKTSKHIDEWKSVEAKITNTKRNAINKTVISYYHIYVDYVYDNVQYVRIKAGKSMARNSRGTNITIYVNPDKPSEITFVNEKEMQMYYIFAYVLAMVLVAVVAYLIHNKNRY